MKLSDYDEVISAYKTYISEFDIGDLRSGHFCDLPIISQWAKKSTLLYLLWREHF